MRKKWPLAIAALALAGCSTATQTAAPAASQPADASTPAAASQAPSNQFKVGQAGHVTGDAGLDATVTLVSLKFYAAPKDTTMGSAPANGQFAVADVLISVKAGSYDYNPLYFKYQAGDATTYDSMSGNADLAGFDPSLSSGTLTAGQKTRGFITWDVPKGKTGVDVQLADPIGSILGQWNVG